MRRFRIGIGFVVLAAAWNAAAHESPGDMVHALSHRMELEGPTARLLAARAYEYESLANWEAAEADFRSALALQPRYGAALAGLASSLLHQGKLADAEIAARQGVALYSDPPRQAPGQAILAKVLVAQNRWDEALLAWRGALEAPNPEVDWFLGESDCLERLGRFAEQSDALAVAKERNPSIVLQRAWVHALISADRLGAADAEIEKGLAHTHWTSTWLLLRARVHARRNQHSLQHRDAAAALAELQQRISPERPDPWLVADTGIALALLGKTEQARACMTQARELGMPDAGLRELNALIAAAGVTAP